MILLIIIVSYLNAGLQPEFPRVSRCHGITVGIIEQQNADVMTWKRLPYFYSFLWDSTGYRWIPQTNRIWWLYKSILVA